MSRPAYALMAVALLVAAVPTLSAQTGPSDVAALRRQYEALAARQRVAGEVFDSLRNARTAPFTDSLVAGGRRVRFIDGQLSAHDQAVLTGALEQVAAELTAHFGERSGVFNDTSSWSLQPRTGRAVRRYLRVDRGVRRQNFPYHHFALPLDSAAVVPVARTAATGALPTLHPWLEQYFRGGFQLDSAWGGFAWAGRSLAISGSTIGRRCQAGSLADCRTVLDVTAKGSYIERFYTPGDWPDLARRLGKPRNVPDSVWTAAQDACVKRAESDACRRILTWQPPPLPFQDNVRTTLAVQALLLGRGPGLDRLLAAHDAYKDNPIGFFAHVAGVPEDSLIDIWRQRVDAAARAEVRQPLLPVFLTSLAWGGLLLLVTTRRRLL